VQPDKCRRVLLSDYFRAAHSGILNVVKKLEPRNILCLIIVTFL